MQSFRELDVFHESKRLAFVAHAMSLKLPQFELFEEGSQIRRSSKAGTSMIVEGFGRRRYKADFVKHLIYSQTECDETIVDLEFLLGTGSCKEPKLFESLMQDYEVLSKRINKFTQWVEGNYISRRP